jgi:hypothetical protein
MSLPFKLYFVPFCRVRQEGKVSVVCSLVTGKPSVGLEMTMRVLHAFMQQVSLSTFYSTYSGDPCPGFSKRGW